MADYIRAQVKGLNELKQNFSNLTDELQKKGIFTATASGGRILREEVRRGAANVVAIRTGRLISSVFLVRDKKQSGNDRAIYHVGVKAGKKFNRPRRGLKGKNHDAFYWKFIEFGHFTRVSGVRGRMGKVKKFAKFLAAVNNGKPPKWISPKPFVRPALASAYDRIVSAIRDSIASSIKRAAARSKRIGKK